MVNSTVWMRMIAVSVPLVAWTFVATGCGNTGFSGQGGGGGSEPIVGAQTAETPERTSKIGELNDPQDDPSHTPSDDQAIAKCLEKFANHPFGDVDVGYRKIDAAVSVFGQGPVVVDDEVTAGPQLVLISAGVNVLGEAVYDLLNPNAYYCMKVNVNVGAGLKVNLACDAALADNKVAVNVGSQADPSTSQVGVNVFSDVQVEKVGCGN